MTDESVSDLAMAFQQVYEETTASNAFALVTDAGCDQDDVIRSAMMGMAGFVASFWYSSAKVSGVDIETTRTGLDMAIDKFWAAAVISDISD